jgi:hypothetical protein
MEGGREENWKEMAVAPLHGGGASRNAPLPEWRRFKERHRFQKRRGRGGGKENLARRGEEKEEKMGEVEETPPLRATFKPAWPFRHVAVER